VENNLTDSSQIFAKIFLAKLLKLNTARSHTTPIVGRLTILVGNSYWSSYSTNYPNHWQRHYYENGSTKQCCERSEPNFFFWFVPPV